MLHKSKKKTWPEFQFTKSESVLEMHVTNLNFIKFTIYRYRYWPIWQLLYRIIIGIGRYENQRYRQLSVLADMKKGLSVVHYLFGNCTKLYCLQHVPPLNRFEFLPPGLHPKSLISIAIRSSTWHLSWVAQKGGFSANLRLVVVQLQSRRRRFSFSLSLQY